MQRRELMVGTEYVAVAYAVQSVPKRTRVRRALYLGPDAGGELRFRLTDSNTGTFWVGGRLGYEPQGTECVLEARQLLMPWAGYRAARSAQLAVERVNAAHRAQAETNAAELQLMLRSNGVPDAVAEVCTEQPVWERQEFCTQVHATLTPEQAMRLLSS